MHRKGNKKGVGLYKTIMAYIGDDFKRYLDLDTITEFETEEERNDFMVDQMFCNDEYTCWERFEDVLEDFWG